MQIHRVLYLKYDTAPTLRFEAGEHLIYLCHRTNLRITFPEDYHYEGARSIAFLRPGQSLEMERCSEFFAYDLLEFSADDREAQLLDELPLPRYPDTSPNFFDVSNLIKSIHFSHHSTDIYRHEKNNARLLLLLYQIADGAPSLKSQSPEHILEYKMTQLRDRLSHTLGHNWTVEEAARTVGLSPSHFSRLYRKYFGESFMKSVIQKRIYFSLQQLEQSTQTVEQIAHELGYEDERFFYRQFKKYMGLTPGIYRELSRSAPME